MYLCGLARLEVPLPLVVCLSFIRVKGCKLNAGPALEIRRPYSTAIDRDLLLLPDVLIEDYKNDVPKALRPAFDALWNAAGWPRSMNYDEEGNWSRNRQR